MQYMCLYVGLLVHQWHVNLVEVNNEYSITIIANNSLPSPSSNTYRSVEPVTVAVFELLLF